LTPEQRRAEINKCLDLVEALGTAWDSWQELGVKTEAPFPDTAWRVVDAYIELLEKRHGTDDLTYWVAKVFGEMDDNAFYSNPRFRYLKTRADFLDYLDAEYPIPQPEEGEDL
jgi:hypothetical protein